MFIQFSDHVVAQLLPTVQDLHRRRIKESDNVLILLLVDHLGHVLLDRILLVRTKGITLQIESAVGEFN